MSKATEELSAALKKRSQIVGFSSSFAKINPLVFADNRLLSQLDSPEWQIVFGRRGAGKTTLLATYARYITMYDDLKIASIELTVPDFINVVESEGEKKISDSDLAKIYFDDFIIAIADHLYDVFTTANRDSKFFRFWDTSGKRKHVEDLVVAIKESTSTAAETPFGSPRTTTEQETTTESLDNNRKSTGKVAVKIDEKITPSIEVNAGIEGGTSSGSSRKREISSSVSHKHYKIDYAKTRKLLEKLLDALGLRSLYIFIDEWTELDRVGLTDVQPLFADLLKRVFWRNSRFVIKIGAVKAFTRLNSTKPSNEIVGLELGADIFELNLDNVYAHRDSLNKILFFENLLFRHLYVCNPALSMFQRREEKSQYGTLEGRPVETFINHIFKSRDVFATLITGSGGLPRDLIEMFDAIAKKQHFSVESPWGIMDVKTSVRDHYIAHKHSQLRKNKSAMRICDRITRLVLKNDSRLIGISNDAESELLLGIAELYHRRLLHDVDAADVPALLRNNYSFYYADLGLLFDVSRERFEGIAGHEEKCPLVGNEELSQVERYILT